MESIIKAMVDEGVSADQLLSFAIDYGIQDDPYIQEVLNQLVAKETRAASPPIWSVYDADDLLDMLKSPEKSQPQAPLKQLQYNAGTQVGAVDHKCGQCSKTFMQRWKLNRHLTDAHNKKVFRCSKCTKDFSQKRTLDKHESTCRGIVTYPCDQCAEVLKTARELEFHQKLKHKAQKRPAKENVPAPAAKRQRVQTNSHQRSLSPQPGPSQQNRESPQPGPSTYNCRQCEAKFQHPKKLQVHNARQHGPQGTRPNDSTRAAGPCTYNCRRCPAQFPDRQALHAHNAQAHYQVGAGLHPEPFERGQEPWVNEDGTIDQGLRDCYRTNRALILERYREGSVDSIYNIPMFPGMRIWDIGQALQGIYDRQRHAFKVNLAFGFIMRHVETGRFRFFRPYDNVNVLDTPVLISRRSDIGKVLKKLKEMDVMAEMAKNRPDTKWRLVLLTNIRVKTFNTNFALGAAVQLPVHITRCKAIISLDKDPVTFWPYNDHLCLFRCLSLHRYGSLAKVDELLKQWQSNYTERECNELLGNPVASRFSGVQLQDLPEFEQRFEINVQMYSLEEDGAVVPVFKSTERYEDTLYVNQYENHCSYVTDFANYAKKFKCQLCDRMFDLHGNFKRHTKICDKKTKFEYPGGFYEEQKTVFDELSDIDILVPEDERTYPWFAVFDFESMLLKLEDDATEKLEWTQRHVPISVSVCSNVPGHTEPRCIVNPDMDQLLADLVECLTIIQLDAADLAKQKWGSYLSELEEIKVLKVLKTWNVIILLN